MPDWAKNCSSKGCFFTRGKATPCQMRVNSGDTNQGAASMLRGWSDNDAAYLDVFWLIDREGDSSSNGIG